MIIAKGSLTGNLVIKQSIQGKINKATEYIEIYPETQAKTVTPTKQTQTILPDENIYALSQVTINPIPDNYIEPQGQKEITDNGTYDVTSFASANVDIEIGKLTNEEYAEANDDLDDILEGTIPMTIYPPDWSELGYSDTPQEVIDGFNYAKQIKDNWDSTQTDINNKFANDTNLVYMPLVDTSNATNMGYMFLNCTNLENIPLLNTSGLTNANYMFMGCTRLKTISLLDFSGISSMTSMFSGCTGLTTIPLLDTSNVQNMNSSFYGCSNLVTVPLLNTSKVTVMTNMFKDCPSLSNESLNNILLICANSRVSTASNRRLSRIGLTSAQATICQGLSNYQTFLDAGWVTGY